MAMSLRSLSLAILAAIAAPVGAQQRPVVATTAGPVRGTMEAGVTAFKGIPFAAPPVGALRWRAPQPPARWAAVRNADAYGHDCMQKPFDSDAAPLGTTPAEDCLTVNVWRPATAAATANLPVLVWIYGGGFVNGGSSPPTYAGAAMARKGIVFVSFNYRLGRFGSFAHPALTKANADGGLLANYGTLDQVAALRWIQANIAAFGGDPAKVTIVGESAGGFSVHALMTSPMARGLFRGAVIQSGGPKEEPAPSLADAEAAGIAFARSKGIAGGDDALAALRALPADAVVDGLNLASRDAPGPRTYVGPIADGWIAVDPRPAYRAGTFAHVPVMLGATSDDIGGATGYMARGAATMAALLAEQGVPTWRYRFSYVAASARAPVTKGAAHATDIPFFFDTADVKYGAATTATDRAAAKLASDTLAAFVKTDDPAIGNHPAWPRYRAEAPQMIDFDAAGGATIVPGD